MRIRRTLALLTPTLAVLAATATTAPAATVSTADRTEVVGSHGETTAVHTARFTAAPGERNDVTVSLVPAANGGAGIGDVVFSDTGAPLTAGTGCAAQADGSVRCNAAPAIDEVWVDLGDGDDRVTLAHPPVSLHWPTPHLAGGDGNDVLDASAAYAMFASFDGGAGDDIEIGGSGTDTFAGDPGHDTILGGQGQNQVDYGKRTDPVQATLGSPARPGDEDVLSGIQRVDGGKGADDLAGSSGPDTIDGGPGADRIDGRGGDDLLSGGTPSAADVVLGGAGSDIISLAAAGRADGGPGDDAVSGGKRSRVAGGPGHDALTGGVVIADDDGTTADYVTCSPRSTARVRATLGAGDVSTGCARHLRRTAGPPVPMALDQFAGVRSAVVRGRHMFYMTLWCGDEAPSAGCPTRIVVRDRAGRTIARRALKLHRDGRPGNTPTQLAIPYNNAFRARLVAAGALPVTVEATARAPHGRVVHDRMTRCLQADESGGADPVPCR